MDLCPHLAEEVRRGCARNHGFVVLHGDHRAALQRCLGVDAKRISVVGAGYRDELFHPRGRRRQSANRIVYVGKLSFAKGLPWLLDAFERLAASQRASGGQIAYQAGPLRLHVVGSGAGPQAELLSGRIESGAPQVIGHGSLSQAELAELFRRCSVCVLPSFYEGLPLVVVEALACGCGVVASSVPGVLHELVPRFRDAIDVVELPRMVGPDTPVEEDLPQFVGQLGGALRRALRRPPLVAPVAATRAALARYTWDAVFRRVETVWRSVMP
jgi:glycosyltransferase involved in cell wall biosynthesis